MERKILNPLH
jgi:hypothetical protein